MKILIVMSGFFPGRKYGGPPVSIDNFCSLMMGKVDCYIVTRNHDLGEQITYDSISSGWNDRGNTKVMYLPENEFTKIRFEQIIVDLSPDYIYLQGLFQRCVLPCLQLAKKLHIKVLLAPRGELCSGAFNKKFKKMPYIAYLRLTGLLSGIAFQSTSTEETEAIRNYLRIPEERIHLLTNIPSIPSNLPKRKPKRAAEGRFVFLSRILWKKNLLMAIRFLKGIEGKVVFDIYGPIEDENYWSECNNAIDELSDNIIVRYRGILGHEKIYAAFSEYDAFLFPTLSENFGHVIAESLLSGCIPIISDQTPWTDMNDAGAGWAIPLANKTAFAKAIQQVVDMDNDEISQKRDNIMRYLDTKLKLDQLKVDYLSVFK